MANKSAENKSRAHAAKILQKSAKSPRKTASGKSKQTAPKGTVALKEQYEVIRKDIIKLRDDLAKGYDMTKNWMDKKNVMREILRTR